MFPQAIRRRAHQRAGNSLAEVLVSSMLVGVVIVGALNVTGGAVKTRKMNAQRSDGPELAVELWSEIMSLFYEDPEAPGSGLGLESGEAAPRVNFDDVDDYEGWYQTPPVDANGVAMTQYTGWTREVDVEWTNLDQGDDSTLSETGLKRFRVRVTSPDGTVYERHGLRYRNGEVEQPPAINVTIVEQISSQLQLGQAPAQSSTINVTNHADAP